MDVNAIVWELREQSARDMKLGAEAANRLIARYEHLMSAPIATVERREGRSK